MHLIRPESASSGAELIFGSATVPRGHRGRGRPAGASGGVLRGVAGLPVGVAPAAVRAAVGGSCGGPWAWTEPGQVAHRRRL